MALSARLCFEALLTELSKVNAPSMLLLDFNYYFNKAINQYVNKRYNIYDTNQQTTDDLRVLKSSSFLKPIPVKHQGNDWKIEIDGKQVDLSNISAGDASLFGATAEVELPLDYLHALNCICIYKVDKLHKCYNEGDYVQFAAKRLTSDTWSTVINDYYNRPLPERPYFFIHNYNKQSDLPTNEYEEKDGKISGTDLNPYEEDGVATVNLNNLLGKNLDESKHNIYNKLAGDRLGNSSPVRMEIRYGMDDVFKLVGVLIDYIKVPQTIRLTQEQVNLTEDKSQIMEFPDYVCQEIINELVLVVMESTADPRLQTHTAVSQSIANPVQQLAQPRPTRQTLA